MPPGTFPPPWSEPLPGEDAGASQQEEVTGAGLATGHAEKRSFHWSVRGEKSSSPLTPLRPVQVRGTGTWAGVAWRPMPHAWLTALLLPFFNS